MATALAFLNWFKMLAVDGRIDSTNYRAFEKIYTDKTEVKKMFVNAISEKDKRLIAESEARGEAKGKAEGRAEGELEALRRTAKKMKAGGVPEDVISKYTGLAQKEIREL